MSLLWLCSRDSRGGGRAYSARHLAKFQSEPGIVQVYETFEANHTAYIVTEYSETKIEASDTVDVEVEVETLYKGYTIETPDNTYFTEITVAICAYISQKYPEYNGSVLNQVYEIVQRTPNSDPIVDLMERGNEIYNICPVIEPYWIHARQVCLKLWNMDLKGISETVRSFFTERFSL